MAPKKKPTSLTLYQLFEDAVMEGKTENEIKEILKDSFKSALKEVDCQIICPIPENARSEVGHMTGMIRDIGSGDLERGIETIRDNHKFIKRWHLTEQKVGSWVLKAVVVFVMGVMLTATWFGLTGRLPLMK
jgi:hypothetical protein